MNYLVVFIGGGVGSVLRYGLGLVLPKTAEGFPWPTFAANILATLLLALLVVFLGKGKSAQEQMWYMLLGVGLCGGFSTFSTFSMETVELWRSGHTVMALGYAAASLGVCLCAITLVLALLNGTRG